MAVQVWIGEKPEHPNERRALIALANGLDRLDELYIMLANFSVGGNTIDLVILKRDAIFIIELKHCDGRVFGSVNGQWTVVNNSGSTKVLNMGRKNPYNQVISYAHAFTNFLNDNKREFLSSQKAGTINFRASKRVVVVAPSIQEGSEIEVDWKVSVKGLDELPTYLVTERSTELNLTEAEMRAIPELLHCVPWQELNDLVAGVIPPWDETPDEPPVPAPPEAPVEAVEVAVAQPPESTLQRWLRAHPWVRVGFLPVLGVLTALVLLVTGWPKSEPPTGTATPSTVGQGTPARTILVASPAPTPQACEFEFLNKPASKRWDPKAGDNGAWVPADLGASKENERPHVIVRLEEIAFCQGQIRIHWTLQNLWDRDVSIPLNNENVRILDNTLVSYLIAEDDPSLPPEIAAEPGESSDGWMVIPRSVNEDAQTLQIQLLRDPFPAPWVTNVSH